MNKQLLLELDHDIDENGHEMWWLMCYLPNMTQPIPFELIIPKKWATQNGFDKGYWKNTAQDFSGAVQFIWR